MGNSQSLNAIDFKDIMEKTSYSKEDIKQLYKDFKAADTDGKVGFSFDEFRAFFKIRFQGLSEDIFRRMFNLFDSDHNGVLDFKEFTSALFLITKASNIEKLEFLFELYDEDRSGYLSPDECSKIISNAYESSKKLGGDSETYFDITAAIFDMDRSNGGITKQEWVSKAIKNEKLLSFLCFYKSFGDFLY